MMIPEAYEGRDDLPEDLNGFYAFHSCLMEPWDGPAAVAFTDGRVIGATLDRNGLRPGRWLETKDGWVVLGSETGVIDEPPENVLRKGRLQPGKLFLVDLDARPDRRGRRGQARGRRAAAVRRVVRSRASSTSPTCPTREPAHGQAEPLRNAQLAFGYTQEDLRVLLAPTAARGEEPIGSMGNDLGARRAQRQPAAAVLLLQAAVRAGHQPADRPDPRGDRDERGDRRRLRAQPARRDARARAPARDGHADPAQRRAGEAAPGRLGRLPRVHDRHHVAGRRGPGRDGRGARPRSAPRPTRRSPTASTS